MAENKPFDTFPQSLLKIAQKTLGMDGDYKKRSFSEVEKQCAKLIKETGDLGAVKIFLLWFLKAVTGLKEKEAAQKIDALAKELRGDTASVLDDYPDGEEKWHSDKYPPKNKKNKEFTKKVDAEFDRVADISDEEFEALAEKEDPVAMCIMGTCCFGQFFKEEGASMYVKRHSDGDEDFMGVEWNEKLWQDAVSILKFSASGGHGAEKGFAYAQYALAYYYLRGAMELEKVIEANRPICDYGYEWIELAIDNDTCRIFVFYAQALYWLRQSAAQGYIDAIEDLSGYYNSGDNGGFEYGDLGGIVIVTRTRGEETERQRKQREFSESIDAQAATIFEKGEAALKKNDLVSAVNYFKDALHVSYCNKKYDKPLADAIAALGFKPLEEKDREKAEEMYQKGCASRELNRRDYWWEAALLGHLPSAQELCTEYIIAVHTSQTGNTLRKMLADAGYAKAQYDLANEYYYGIEYKKNIKKAAELYQKAAEQGYEYAINAVKSLREKGEIK